MTKQILSIAGYIFLGVVIISLLVNNRHLKDIQGTTGHDLRKNDKNYIKELNASRVEIMRLREIVKVWQDSVSTFKKGKQEADLKASIAKKKYENLKNSIPVHYSDRQIDSLITVYTGFTR